MADSVQGSVAAVGSAWKYVRDNHPTIDLYTTDGSHPSMEGSYLAACTFYTSLFRKTPVGSTYYATLDANTAGILQNAAALTVLDSLDHWNLRPISEHTLADFTFVINGNSVDFTNLSTKATDYTWDFGDLNTSISEHPSNTYSTPGTYTVSLISNSPCDSDTMEIEISIGSAGIEQVVIEVQVLSLGDGIYQVKSDEPIQSLEVRDLMGRLIILDPQSGIIDLSNQSSGIYIVEVRSNDRRNTVKLFR